MFFFSRTGVFSGAAPIPPVISLLVLFILASFLFVLPPPLSLSPSPPSPPPPVLAFVCYSSVGYPTQIPIGTPNASHNTLYQRLETLAFNSSSALL